MTDQENPSPTTDLSEKVSKAATIMASLKSEISKAFVGQQEVLDQVLISLLASGHVLIEGVPGLGKTLLVRSLARCINGQFSRVQFTPDLMPNDVTGHGVYDMATKEFQVRKGPAFTNLLLADEINRSPAKTQSALLEVMQERQITIEGEAYKTGEPFMVLATQNPIEQEGTFPLPEAELDRFLMKIFVDYPSTDEEQLLVKLATEGRTENFHVDNLKQILSTDTLGKIQKLASVVTLDEAVLDYVVRLVRATRDWSGIAKGAGPRASIALVRAAKAKALMAGVSFVTPDNVKAVALPILRHRILLTADMEIEGVEKDQLLTDILDHVEAPRQ